MKRLSPVSPLYYDRPNGGRKGVGLCPYPYAVGVTSFACKRNITTVFAPSYHVAARQHFTFRLRNISPLQKGFHSMNDKENKNCIISFRVTAEEKKWIEDHSYGNYRLISDFVRDCVFKKDIVIINGLDEFSAQFRRIGNNVNQLARAVNAGFVSQINLTETRKELEKIWQSLNLLLQDAR